MEPILAQIIIETILFKVLLNYVKFQLSNVFSRFSDPVRYNIIYQYALDWYHLET